MLDNWIVYSVETGNLMHKSKNSELTKPILSSAVLRMNEWQWRGSIHPWTEMWSVAAAHSLSFFLQPLGFSVPCTPKPTPPSCTRSNRMMNSSISLPSIYFPQKLEPLLCCHNHWRRLRWAACIIIHIPAGSRTAMLTHYPHRQIAAWFMAMTQAFDCLCVCGATIRKWSSQQKSNKERTVRRPSSHHNCGYLQSDIAVGSPDIFYAPGKMNQHLYPH